MSPTTQSFNHSVGSCSQGLVHALVGGGRGGKGGGGASAAERGGPAGRQHQPRVQLGADGAVGGVPGGQDRGRQVRCHEEWALADRGVMMMMMMVVMIMTRGWVNGQAAAVVGRGPLGGRLQGPGAPRGGAHGGALGLCPTNRGEGARRRSLGQAGRGRDADMGPGRSMGRGVEDGRRWKDQSEHTLLHCIRSLDVSGDFRTILVWVKPFSFRHRTCVFDWCGADDRLDRRRSAGTVFIGREIWHHPKRPPGGRAKRRGSRGGRRRWEWRCVLTIVNTAVLV
jgi:hypothetical protein